MGKKKYITIDGRTQTLTEWAREFGVSRQRISKLYNSGQLEKWMKGELVTGRPRRLIVPYDVLKETMHLKGEEVSRITGLPLWAVYYYRKKCGE